MASFFGLEVYNSKQKIVIFSLAVLSCTECLQNELTVNWRFHWEAKLWKFQYFTLLQKIKKIFFLV